MNPAAIIEHAIGGTWTGIYVRVLAVVLAYGAVMHVGNILGWPGRPWVETPLLWRVLDVVLLVFNIVVAVGLWRKLTWAVIAFVVGIVAFQLVPYTVLRHYFFETPEQARTLDGLVGTWLVLLTVLLLLVWLRK